MKDASASLWAKIIFLGQSPVFSVVRRRALAYWVRAGMMTPCLTRMLNWKVMGKREEEG